MVNQFSLYHLNGLSSPMIHNPMSIIFQVFLYTYVSVSVSRLSSVPLVYLFKLL